MRVAVIDNDLCKPEKCSLECIDVCPINRAEKKCVFLSERPDKTTKSTIDESLCIDCGLCVKGCPFGAISVVNTPEQLKEAPIHRFGKNQFTLFRLPFPIKGETVGLLGPNGTGKTTALKILGGEIRPNLGGEKTVDIRDLISIFRGTELQAYLHELEKGGIKTVVKPQHVDMLTDVKGTVRQILEKHDERGKLHDTINKLQLNKVLDRQMNQLSGGELQRVAIAIAANRKADFYFIDEPSSYLDVYQRLQAAKLIRELAKEAAVMVVEHDLATLDFLADRVHVLYGVPGAFGVVSKPYSTRVGINAFLDGYLKEDNMRIRKEKIDFSASRLATTAKNEIYLEWGELSKKLGGFSLLVFPGRINKGEILGIFGSNALGKTTFARILAGELEPDSGNVNTTAKISYKPQYIASKFEGTVAELLATVSKNIYAEDYKAEILRPLQLEHLLERNVNKLSGGELQRVAVAMCLSREANLYLLDEPSAYLDSEQRLETARMIRHFCELRECSAMVIDHDLLFLSYLADRAMVFSGEPSVAGNATTTSLQDGFNAFLKEVDVTFRKDPQTGRPRANSPGSQKDMEQKAIGKYFYAE